MTKSQRGGKRAGAGRPRLSPSGSIVTSVSLTPAQREKLAKLGGSAWIQQRINKAKTPE